MEIKLEKSLLESLENYLRGISWAKTKLKILKPPPDLTVSGWADRFRKLSSESSAEPGQWSTARAEYQRGPMDEVTNPLTHTIVFMTSSQVGKSEVLLNSIGYHIDYDPAPMLCLQPNVKPMGEDFSKDRLAPMLRDTEVLKNKVTDPKSRDSGNTIMHKTFPGGHVTIAGANSPASLASRPIRIIYADELDRYPASAGTEGDPLKLAIKRTKTFWNRKIIITSTPTVKGFSRIENEYEESDQRKYYVSCPHCGEMHLLQWGNVVWESGQPETAVMQCPHCNEKFNDAEKNAAVRNGEWRAHAEFRGKAGFHINELYSPWSTLEEIVDDFLRSKNNPEKLQVWVNTTLGETWEEAGETLNDTELMERCENYPAPIPRRGLILTAGVDTQPDRLEVEVVAWGAGEESWSVDYHVIYGDPDIPQGTQGSPWDALLDYIRQPWKHESGVELSVYATAIDSGGRNTQAVYEFCKGKKAQRIYAIKGRGGEGVPIITNPQRKKTGRRAKRPVDVYTVGVDQAKTITYKRLRIDAPGPGYCHFPSGREPEYFRQLTAEKIMTKYVKGFAKREWVKIDGRRNEALDCRVYAFAMLILMSPMFDKLALRIKRQVEDLENGDVIELKEPEIVNVSESSKEAKKKTLKKRKKNRTNFVNRW